MAPDVPGGIFPGTTTVATADVRIAERRVRAFLRVYPDTRFCPRCLAIDLQISVPSVAAAIDRLLGPDGVRVATAVCTDCGAYTAVAYGLAAPTTRGHAGHGGSGPLTP
jgi:hypothetical protein